MSHCIALDSAPRTAPRSEQTAPRSHTISRNPLPLVRIGSGLALLTALAAFVMRAGA
jgi:hypothetical protein